jgi:hypothetical protein
MDDLRQAELPHCAGALGPAHHLVSVHYLVSAHHLVSVYYLVSIYHLVSTHHLVSAYHLASIHYLVSAYYLVSVHYLVSTHHWLWRENPYPILKELIKIYKKIYYIIFFKI